MAQHGDKIAALEIKAGELEVSINAKVSEEDLKGYVTESDLTLLSDEISAKVSSEGVGASFGWSITSDRFRLFTGEFRDGEGEGGEGVWDTETDVFICDKDGVVITGEINARRGQIGDWVMTEGVLHSSYGDYGTYRYYEGGSLSVNLITGYLFMSLRSAGLFFEVYSSNDYTGAPIVYWSAAEATRSNEIV